MEKRKSMLNIWDFDFPREDLHRLVTNYCCCFSLFFLTSEHVRRTHATRHDVSSTTQTAHIPVRAPSLLFLPRRDSIVVWNVCQGGFPRCDSWLRAPRERDSGWFVVASGGDGGVQTVRDARADAYQYPSAGATWSSRRVRHFVFIRWRMA